MTPSIDIPKSFSGDIIEQGKPAILFKIWFWCSQLNSLAEKGKDRFNNFEVIIHIHVRWIQLIYHLFLHRIHHEVRVYQTVHNRLQPTNFIRKFKLFYRTLVFLIFELVGNINAFVHHV